MVAAKDTCRVPIYFLYRRLGAVEYQNDGSNDAWKATEGGGSKVTRLTISHVTTRGPSTSKGRLPCSNVDISTDLGAYLFTSFPARTVWAVCALPGVGLVYITGDEDSQLYLQFVQDRRARPREYNLVFDLDETLIYNPHQMPGSVPGARPVNPYPPHYINDPIDVPHIRPNVLSFLQLVCPHFDQVRVCTMSIRHRATPIVANLDPQQRTLLKNQRSQGKVVICREDLQPNGDSPWMANSMPSTKSLELCRLPAGKEYRTVVLDDCWEIWPCRDNLVAVLAPQEMGGMSHDVYINGDDGGDLGKHILVCLINLALREERRIELIKTSSPVGLTNGPLVSHASYSGFSTGHRPWSIPSSLDYGVPKTLPLTRHRSSSAAPTSHRISPPPSQVVRMDYEESALYSPASYLSTWRTPAYRQLGSDPMTTLRSPTVFTIRQY